mmetsp:Transcript_22107/g.38941  ORF Transcript_22107/g.38941 Transcript_22107/m.38941 type:complete len:82 (-) Transcript_22107:93-338(-)
MVPVVWYSTRDLQNVLQRNSARFSLIWKQACISRSSPSKKRECWRSFKRLDSVNVKKCDAYKLAKYTSSIITFASFSGKLE